jgi:hypothetical protein
VAVVRGSRRSPGPLVLAAAVFAVLGCEQPYNADLNLAGALTSRMTLVGVLGPVNVYGDQLTTTESVFLPARPVATDIGGVIVTSGLVTSTDGFYQTVGFGHVDAGGTTTYVGQKSYPLFGSDSSYPALLTFVGSTVGTTGSFIVAALEPNMPPPNGISGSFELWTAPLPQGPLAYLDTTAYTTTTSTLPAAPWNGASITVVGLCIQPQPSQDLSFWLLTDGTKYAEAQFTVDVTTPATPFSSPTTPVESTLAFLGGATRCLYYHDAARGVSYASFLRGGAWQCWRWEAADANIRQLTGITNRVDALLATGELLSFGNGSLRLYDPSGSGSELLSAPLGSLRFCYETYIGTTPYVFFCQSMRLPYQDWGYRMFVIPTGDVKSLG